MRAAIALIDDNMHNVGVHVAAGSVVKSTTPLLVQDTPWEPRIDNGYPNAMRSSNGEWRLFYGTCEKGCGTQLLLYANSSDGMHWTKPNLGLFDLGNVRPELKHIGTANNVILAGGGIGVYEDVDADASRRFVAFGPGCYDVSFSKSCFLADVYAGARSTYPVQDLAFSSDGLTWRNATSIRWPKPQRYDCHNNLVPMPNAANTPPNTPRRWLATTRDGFSAAPGRTIGIAPSDASGLHFDTKHPPNVTLSGSKSAQLYSQITFPWLDVYLGFVMVYDAESKAGHVRRARARRTDTTGRRHTLSLRIGRRSCALV